MTSKFNSLIECSEYKALEYTDNVKEHDNHTDKDKTFLCVFVSPQMKLVTYYHLIVWIYTNKNESMYVSIYMCVFAV